MGAPYPMINGTAMGNDLSYFFVYVNSVIPMGLFGLFMVIAFYLVVLLGSLIMQLRMTGRLRPETSFMAASFATLGFAIIIEQVSGILSPLYFFLLIVITIISLIWVSVAGD